LARAQGYLVGKGRHIRLRLGLGKYLLAEGLVPRLVDVVAWRSKLEKTILLAWSAIAS